MKSSRRHMYHRSRATAALVFAGLLGCAGLAFAAGCGGRSASGPIPPRMRPAALLPPVSLDGVTPYFVPGETITWELTFLGVEGGRARFAVGRPGLVDGRRVVALTAEAESSGMLAMVKHVRDVVLTWVDVESGTPVRTESEATISGKHILVKTTWRVGQALAEMSVFWQRGAEKRHTRKLPTVETHDPLSALLLLRGWEAPDGSRTTFYTLGGQRLWRTELVVEGREYVDCPLGGRPTIRMSGVSTRMTAALRDDTRKKPRRFTVWLSDDRERIPVRLEAQTEYGSVQITATSYEVTSP